MQSELFQHATPRRRCVLEKLVFLREGTLRENCIVNGEVSDSSVYGLLRREWVARQSGSAAG